MNKMREHRNLAVKDISAAGEFEGYLSTFDNIDSYLDMVKRGAYKKTLKERKRFPLMWGHDWLEQIGSFSGVEDDKGLFITGRINQDVQRGREARSLIINDGLDGLSIGYRVIKWGMEEIDGVGVRVLREIKLNEGSVTAFPADDGARIIAAKSAAMLGDPKALSLDEWRERLLSLSDEQRESIKSLLEAEKSGLVSTSPGDMESMLDNAGMLRSALDNYRANLERWKQKFKE